MIILRLRCFELGFAVFTAVLLSKKTVTPLTHTIPPTTHDHNFHTNTPHFVSLTSHTCPTSSFCTTSKTNTSLTIYLKELSPPPHLSTLFFFPILSPLPLILLLILSSFKYLLTLLPLLPVILFVPVLHFLIAVPRLTFPYLSQLFLPILPPLFSNPSNFVLSLQ